MRVLGGNVEKAPVREYGKTQVHVDPSSPLFAGVERETVCWMSHFDYISRIAPGFSTVAHTDNCPVAAAQCPDKKLYAIQFHPEVLHTKHRLNLVPLILAQQTVVDKDAGQQKLVFRQPFPGPGLGIRIIGEVTAEKVHIVQDADAIYREEVDKAAATYVAEI